MLDNIKEIHPTILSAILAIFVSVLRIVYDREETSAMRIILESVLCGTLAVIAGSGIAAMGMDDNWTLFVGGFIGFVGSQSIRTFAQTFVKNKLNEK